MHALGLPIHPFTVSLQGYHYVFFKCISILFADTQATWPVELGNSRVSLYLLY